MKNARGLVAFFLFYGGVAVTIHADPDSSADNENPAAHDPDAVPRAAYVEAARALPHVQAKETRDASATREKDQNWLVQGYEQQMQARALEQGNHDVNLYAELSDNKDLAKLAGLSNSNPMLAPATGLLTGPGTSSPTLSLRPDASLTSVKVPAASFTTSNPAFKPFITPLGETEAAGLHNFYSSIPALSATALPQTTSSANADPGALDIPGMTAAESDPTKRAELDLSLDSLPGNMSPGAKENQNLSLDLPVATNTERLQKQSDTTLNTPGKRKTIAPLPINPRLLQPISDTAQMVPDPPPVRGQVDDPYDILR